MVEETRIHENIHSDRRTSGRHEDIRVNVNEYRDGRSQSAQVDVDLEVERGR